MTTLSANANRPVEGGVINALPMIASDIIFAAAAVGLVAASGHARPLEAGDLFAGFADRKADNSDGAAAAINVEVIEAGKIQLSVTGVTITDVGEPVYATDDDTFTMNPVGASFVGFVHRFVSSGVAVVRFDAAGFRDPYEGTREAITGDKTLDVQDSGKIFFVTADATITLPAIAAPPLCKIVNAGSYGTVGITVSPAAADMIEGPDITAANDKDIVNTKTTARRGDFIRIGPVDADGYAISELKGTWAREA